MLSYPSLLQELHLPFLCLHPDLMDRFSVGDNVYWKVGRARSGGVIVCTCTGGLDYVVRNIKSGKIQRRKGRTLHVDPLHLVSDATTSSISTAASTQMHVEEAAAPAPFSKATTSSIPRSDAAADAATAATLARNDAASVPASTPDADLRETEDDLIKRYDELGNKPAAIRILEARMARLSKQVFRAAHMEGLSEGVLLGRTNLPGGSSRVLGSIQCSSINTTVTQDAWFALDADGSFGRFWDLHAQKLRANTYSLMQCFENPTDIPAYTMFGSFLSDLAQQIRVLVGGSSLVASPSCLVPPQSTLQKSVFSDGDLIPDVIWACLSNLFAHTAESVGDIFAELKSFKQDVRERVTRFTEAIGQLFKIACLLFGRLFQKQMYMDKYEMTSIVSDGVHVQICYTTVGLSGVEKPLRQVTDILQVVNSIGLVEVGDEASRIHTIDTMASGYKEVAFAVFRCLRSRGLQVASEEARDLCWQEGLKIKLRATQCYVIGTELLPIMSPWNQGPDSELLATVEEVICASPMCVVAHVTYAKKKWCLKLGPQSKYKNEALSFGAHWASWFQVEREMYFRDRLCPKVCADAFPVVVQGSSRPAMLARYEGVSLDKLIIRPEDVSCLSMQLYEILCHVSSHNVRHNDISLRNICCKNGVYSLIDWGLASGRGLMEFLKMVHDAFPMAGAFSLDVWTVGCMDFGVVSEKRDFDDLLFCCLEALNGKLPWADAAAVDNVEAVTELKNKTKVKMLTDPQYMKQDFIHKPLLDSWLLGVADTNRVCQYIGVP